MSKTVDLTPQELAELNSLQKWGRCRVARCPDKPPAPHLPLYSIGPSGIGGYAQAEYYPQEAKP